MNASPPPKSNLAKKAYELAFLLQDDSKFPLSNFGLERWRQYLTDLGFSQSKTEILRRLITSQRNMAKLATVITTDLAHISLASICAIVFFFPGVWLWHTELNIFSHVWLSSAPFSLIESLLIVIPLGMFCISLKVDIRRLVKQLCSFHFERKLNQFFFCFGRFQLARDGNFDRRM